MRWKMITIAVFSAIGGLHSTQAQTIAQIGDPAELPAAGYVGDQFIDSRGCVFMRISSGGQAQWYPRVDATHKVVCGYPPTFGAKPQVTVVDTAPTQPTVAAKPAPVVAAASPARVVPAAKPATKAEAVSAKPATAAPMPTVASKMKPAAMPVLAAEQPAPYVAVAPASYEVATSASIPPGKIGCFRSAPVAEVVKLQSGGSIVVCTRGDGTATGWRAPIYPIDTAVGASRRPSAGVPVASSTPQKAAPRRVVPVATVAPAPVFTVPKGYKLAWDDGRLNPRRGQGTAAGWAQQDQLWTHTTPAHLISDAVNPRIASSPVYRSNVSVSAMNPAQKAAKADP